MTLYPYWYNGLLCTCTFTTTRNVHFPWYEIIMNRITICKDFVDPLGRPTITAGNDPCFRTCFPSVRPHFSNSSKTKQISIFFFQISNKSCEFKMTHQATANRWWLFSCMVYVVERANVSIAARFSFSDGRTHTVKIMTTYSAVAWWVN